MRTTSDTPDKCPDCGARVVVLCKFRDQKRAKIIKLAGIVAAGGIAFGSYAIEVHFFNRLTISWPPYGPIAGLAVGSAIYGYGHGITKIRDVGCTKCKWRESFRIVKKTAGFANRRDA